MDTLFAPFDGATFPRQLSVPQLTKLLESPLATQVPLPPSTYQSVHQLYPDLFVEETNASAPLLASTLVKSLQTPWPTGSPTELLYTPFWATVGYGLPEVIGRQLGLNVSESRDKEDASITIADKRRDYMQHLDNVLVVGGEDKPKRELMQKAVQELLDKHKGANAAVYGDLGYLILFATAADAVRVFALNLHQNARLEPLIPEFVMVDLLGRQRIVKLFINLIRWLRTVHELSLLPPPPPAQLLVPFKRPSPYPADEAGHQQSEVEITLRFKGVEKLFTVPGSHVQELLDVYGLLQHLQLPGAILCKSLQVNGEQLKLQYPMSKQRKASRRSRSCSVRLRLEPLGALVRITGTAQLRSLVSCILTTLKHVHQHDFVHRDIRLDNVLRVNDGWLLIDWELAGRTNQLVWWEGKLLPDAVKHRTEPFTCKTDLWQLGMLIKTATVCADVAITSFADRLLAGEFTTAALAQASLW
ncbi:TPA: hypothetical protein ACH3X1_011712 [Trebouxia sp. C0004]